VEPTTTWVTKRGAPRTSASCSSHPTWVPSPHNQSKH
jgi:hypothetical protein